MSASRIAPSGGRSNFSIFDYDLHTTVASLADATVGALQRAQLAVSGLGRGRALAVAKSRDPRSTPSSRWIGSSPTLASQMAACWVPFVIGPRPEIVAALDWSDLDPDDQVLPRLEH